jgi:hypothetical protein
MFSSANGLFEASPSDGANSNGDRGRRRRSQPSFIGARAAAAYKEEPVFAAPAKLPSNNYYDSGQASNNEDGLYYGPHGGNGSLHRQNGRIIIALLVLLIGWLSRSFPSATHSSPMSSSLDLMATIIPGISHFITSGDKGKQREDDNDSEEEGPRPVMLGIELRIRRPEADEMGLRNEYMVHLREDILSEHIAMKELKAMAEEELMLEAEDAGLRVGFRNRVLSNLREKIITGDIEMQELKDLAE